MVRSRAIAPPSTPLTDGSVVVRPRIEADMDAIAAAGRDPEALRWLEDPPMDAERRRTAMHRAEEAWRSGRAAPFTIADASTDEAVGMINLQFRADDTVTVAYNVFPAHRGHGIAPRALLLVADWALADRAPTDRAPTDPALAERAPGGRAPGGLGVTELILEADEANAASIRVAEKCGFQAVGTKVETASDGTERTAVVFSRSLT